MKKLKIGKSNIHGKGLFSGEPIKKGELIAKVHNGVQLDPETVKYMPTQYGRFYNHADTGFNTSNEIIGNHRYLRALKNIPANSELTANYKEHPEMEQPEDFGSGKYASFDFDKTIATDEGLAKARQMLKDGYNLFIVSAREKVTPDMVERARKAGIPEENIIATGSDEAKVRKVKQLGVEKHFDDKPEVISALGSIGEQFKKGGGVNSKRYTKSLTGTNKLFTKNNLFKKKSTKRIYDPNAKYFATGGSTIAPPDKFPTGGTVSQKWETITGTPWADAKTKGFTTGSFDDNINLLKKLNSGELDVSQDLSTKVSATDPAPTGLRPIDPALVNNITSANSFNEAFTIARKALGANHIFEYDGRKYGTNMKGETFNPSAEVLSAAGMNTPQVKTRLQNENKDLMSPFLSKSTVKLQPDPYEDWEEVKKKDAEINKQNNASKIISYKQKTKDDKNFIIVDKKKGLLHVYDPKGTQLFSSAIDVGALQSDAQTVTKYKDLNKDGKISGNEINKNNVDWEAGNLSTGAGKFYISNIDPVGYEGLPILNMMNEGQHDNFLKTGKIENVSTSFHKGYIKDDKSRVSNGCIRCNKTTLDNLTNYLQNSSEVYILPEEKGNDFIYENGKLNFKVNSGKDYNNYTDQTGKSQKGQGVNRTQNTLNYKPIKINFDETKFRDQIFTATDTDDENELRKTKLFVNGLQDNKQSIMKAAKINGDVYNEIAKMAFGIYGTETNYADTHSGITNFGRAVNKWLDPKNSSSPDYESKYNTYDAKKNSNSVGLTQIRWSYLNEDEKKALKQVGITSNKDFMSAKNAAIGTAVILGIRYNQQLTAAQKKDLWKYLPTKWNTRDNYADRVKQNSRFVSVAQYTGNDKPKTVTKTPANNYGSPYAQSNIKTFEDGGFIEIDIPNEQVQEYIKKGYNVEEIDTFQNGGQKEGEVLDIPEMQAYADPNKRKLQGKLIDKARAIASTIEGRQALKEGNYKDFSIESLKRFIKSATDYKKEAENYHKARRLVSEEKMDPDSFARRYNEKGWAKFDEATANENYKGEYQQAVDKANKRKGKNMAYTDAVFELSGAAPLRRMAANPIGTAEGVGQTIGDLVTLPYGLVKGGYNYATDGNFDMGTNPFGQEYGEGLNETLDALTLLPFVGSIGKGVNLAKPALIKGVNKLGKYATTQTPLAKTYKLNPYAERLNDANKSYRVAGLDALEDFQNTGVLRSATPTIPEGANLFQRAEHRPTAFPSFQKGYADMSYAPKEGAVVFETKLPTFKRGDINPVTGEKIKGRHYAHRVIDPKTGRTMTEIPGSEIKIFGDNPHWLKGYPEVPKTLPGSANNSGVLGANVTNIKSFIEGPAVNKGLSGTAQQTEGAFNKGIFNVVDDPNFIIKLEHPKSVGYLRGMPDYENVNMAEAMQGISGPTFGKVHHQVLSPTTGNRALILNKLQGTPYNELTMDDYLNISDEGLVKFHDDLQTLKRNNLGFDFTGNNYMYDRNTNQFQLFDIDPHTTMFDPSKSATYDFFQTQVYGGGNPLVFGNKQAGLNLQGAMKNRLGSDIERKLHEAGVTSQDASGVSMDYQNRIQKLLKGLNYEKDGGAIEMDIDQDMLDQLIASGFNVEQM